mmetsp:Transcript_108199/g.258219  ORF Transcript_108199/g.258219 Transcript_108199/m.258219 type:complete len:273 (-) Transcript_108199:142-960(-)
MHAAVSLWMTAQGQLCARLEHLRQRLSRGDEVRVGVLALATLLDLGQVRQPHQLAGAQHILERALWARGPRGVASQELATLLLLPALLRIGNGTVLLIKCQAIQKSVGRALNIQARALRVEAANPLAVVVSKPVKRHLLVQGNDLALILLYELHVPQVFGGAGDPALCQQLRRRCEAVVRSRRQRHILEGFIKDLLWAVTGAKHIVVLHLRGHIIEAKDLLCLQRIRQLVLDVVLIEELRTLVERIPARLHLDVHGGVQRPFAILQVHLHVL